MGTTLLVIVPSVVVLLFIGLSALDHPPRRAGARPGQGRFCGAALEPVGMEFTTRRRACGRQQPWDTDPPVT